MSPRYRTEFQRISLDKKMAAYTLAGAAVLAAPAIAKANSITYVPNVNVTVNEPGSYAFNLSGPSSADITVTSSFTTDSSGNPAHFINVTTAGGAQITDVLPNTASALNAGDTIDPNNTSCGLGSCWQPSGKLVGYDTVTNSTVGYWSATGGSSYLGFYFDGGGGPQAGWAKIATSANASTSSFEILSYAYENDPKTAILAGQTVPTPEPGTMTLLALGGAGLAALRRRRAQRA